MIEYKRYLGIVVFDTEIDAFHGTVCSTNDVITFYGASETELQVVMKNSVETYF